jgi:3-oxoadipate enol-lactonase
MSGAVPALPSVREVVLPGRGTTVAYESAGPPDAPTLMLLHGLGATASLNWFTSFPVLEDEFHVVAPDHRGHGRGIRAATPFTLEDAADDVVALADALGIERFVAVGYSMGGPIAQLVWRRHHDRVTGLVMCATSYRFRAAPAEHLMFAALPVIAIARRFLPEALARHIIAHVAGAHLSETGFADWARRELLRRDPRAVWQAAAALGGYSAAPWIGEIDVPTSVLVHTRDQLVPPPRQAELAAAIPGAVRHVVDADHFAVVRDPDAFVRALVPAVHHAASAPAATERVRDAESVAASAGRGRRTFVRCGARVVRGAGGGDLVPVVARPRDERLDGVEQGGAERSELIDEQRPLVGDAVEDGTHLARGIGIGVGIARVPR